MIPDKYIELKHQMAGRGRIYKRDILSIIKMVWKVSPAKAEQILLDLTHSDRMILIQARAGVYMGHMTHTYAFNKTKSDWPDFDKIFAKTRRFKEKSEADKSSAVLAAMKMPAFTSAPDAAKWLTAQPAIAAFIFDYCKNNGSIQFTDGQWHGASTKPTPGP
jgi:hypothetical protein